VSFVANSKLRAKLRGMRCLFTLTAVLVTAVLASCGAATAADDGLAFVREGSATKRISRAALAEGCGVQKITVEDPYYNRSKSYLACPLANVLRVGFGDETGGLAALDIVFRASDGYARPSAGAIAIEAGGWLAFTDADRGTVAAPAWEPIDRRQVDPGPFYVVWTGAQQSDAKGYPWPYQLVQIEIASLEKLYPHTVPGAAPAGSPERAGYAIFKSQCIACHSINGEGGKIGPDLNVPRSIVEYRPEAQIRQYVREPASFRYTSMPAHPGLTDGHLDSLIAYFRAMSGLKHDPGRPS